jgi:transcription factor SPN1
MNIALEMDRKSNGEKKAGLARFKLLEAISQYSKNEIYKEELVSNLFCDIAAKWLSPLPDGSMPNPRIRNVILEALWELPVETEHLDATQLGRIVRSLSVYPRETRANKGMFSVYTNILISQKL